MHFEGDTLLINRISRSIPTFGDSPVSFYSQYHLEAMPTDPDDLYHQGFGLFQD
jgi:hypothetical protein